MNIEYSTEQKLKSNLLT